MSRWALSVFIATKKLQVLPVDFYFLSGFYTARLTAWKARVIQQVQNREQAQSLPKFPSLHLRSCHLLKLPPYDEGLGHICKCPALMQIGELMLDAQSNVPGELAISFAIS